MTFVKFDNYKCFFKLRNDKMKKVEENIADVRKQSIICSQKIQISKSKANSLCLWI
jgi:hypothetical protein